jgi:hypothetical protein
MYAPIVSVRAIVSARPDGDLRCARDLLAQGVDGVPLGERLLESCSHRRPHVVPDALEAVRRPGHEGLGVLVDDVRPHAGRLLIHHVG